MNVSQLSIKEQIDENGALSKESTRDEWIWEGLITHSMVIAIYQLVDIQFTVFYFFRSSFRTSGF